MGEASRVQGAWELTGQSLNHSGCIQQTSTWYLAAGWPQHKLRGMPWCGARRRAGWGGRGRNERRGAPGKWWSWISRWRWPTAGERPPRGLPRQSPASASLSHHPAASGTGKTCVAQLSAGHALRLAERQLDRLSAAYSPTGVASLSRPHRDMQPLAPAPLVIAPTLKYLGLQCLVESASRMVSGCSVRWRGVVLQSLRRKCRIRMLLRELQRKGEECSISPLSDCTRPAQTAGVRTYRKHIRRNTSRNIASLSSIMAQIGCAAQNDSEGRPVLVRVLQQGAELLAQFVAVRGAAQCASGAPPARSWM